MLKSWIIKVALLFCPKLTFIYTVDQHRSHSPKCCWIIHSNRVSLRAAKYKSSSGILGLLGVFRLVKDGGVWRKKCLYYWDGRIVGVILCDFCHFLFNITIPLQFSPCRSIESIITLLSLFCFLLKNCELVLEVLSTFSLRETS